MGRGGRPHLVAETSLEASKYIPILEESTGGDFGLEILEDRDVFDDDEFDDEFDDTNLMMNMTRRIIRKWKNITIII